MTDIILSESNKKDKKYSVFIDNKTIHFGSKNSSTYINHKDDIIKKNWISRHSKLSDFNDIYKPSYWSKNILWNKKDLNDSIKHVSKKLNRNIILV